MFPPSREKVEAAERYLAEMRIRVSRRGWKNKLPTSGRTRTGKPLWHSLPAKWHDEANERLARLVNKYWREHGHGPSHHKYISLVGNVVQYILYCRMTHHFRAMHQKVRNCRKCVYGPYTPNPFKRDGFTPRTSKARSSSGNLTGI